MCSYHILKIRRIYPEFSCLNFLLYHFFLNFLFFLGLCTFQDHLYLKDKEYYNIVTNTKMINFEIRLILI